MVNVHCNILCFWFSVPAKSKPIVIYATTPLHSPTAPTLNWFEKRMMFDSVIILVMTVLLRLFLCVLLVVKGYSGGVCLSEQLGLRHNTENI